MSTPGKMPITTRALLMRINRKLAHDGQIMRSARPNSRMHNDYGPYYIAEGHFIQACSIRDLAKFAAECGCMHPYEVWDES